MVLPVLSDHSIAEALASGPPLTDSSVEDTPPPPPPPADRPCGHLALKSRHEPQSVPTASRLHRYPEWRGEAGAR